MNLTQKTTLTMFLVTEKCLQAYNAIVMNLPGYQANRAIFGNSLEGINRASEQQIRNMSGIAYQKKINRKTLVQLACNASAKVFAFATNVSDPVLMKETDLKKSDLQRLRDIDLKNTSQLIHSRASEHLPELADYMVDAELLKSLEDAISRFSNSITQPKMGQNEVKITTRQLKQLFSDALTALRNIDTIVEIVRTSQPAFYMSYKDSRKLPATGRSTVALKMQINDSTTGMGLKGVKAIITLTDDGKASPMNGNAVTFTRKTALKGGLRVKSLATGTYQVMVKKAGYEEQVLTVSVNEGETSYLKTLLKRA